VAVIVEHSIAAEYSGELCEWLPEATELTQIASHEGRDLAGVNAGIGAAKGRAKTRRCCGEENGGSICGGYVDSAWAEGRYRNAPRTGTRSFIFTSRNPECHPSSPRRNEATPRHSSVSTTAHFSVKSTVWDEGCRLNSGRGHEAPGEGMALFCGDGGGVFDGAGWELWEAC
jgi:hypothetical protein